MTSAPKTNETATQPTPSRSRRDDDDAARPALGEGTSSDQSQPPIQDQLEDLVRAQEDLARQIRELTARQLVQHQANGNGGARTGQVVAKARAELLQDLLREQQEQARSQLEASARSGEDAVAGVVRSITTIVRSTIPPAVVRPEDLIQATFSLADQGLRMGRQVALTVTAGARDLAPFG